MFDAAPPPKPAIIRVGDVWKHSLDAALLLRGVPRSARRAVISELERIAKGKRLDFRSGVEDLSRWAKVSDLRELPLHPVLAMPLMTTAASASARALRGKAAASLPHSYRNFYSDPANASTYTFTSADLGTAAANRHIIVGINGVGGSASQVSSVTIGGVSAARVIAGTLQYNSPIEIWIAAVPTGATGDIVVNFNGSESAASVSVWAAYLASATPVDIGDGTGTFNDTLNSTAGGFAVAITMLNPTAGSTWTNVTENYDTVVDGNSQMSGASATTAGSSINIQRTPSSTYNNATIAATFA